MEKNMERMKEQILRTSGVNPLKCMKCGKCSGTCPSYDEMEYHPHQFVAMVEQGDIEPLRTAFFWSSTFILSMSLTFPLMVLMALA